MLSSFLLYEALRRYGGNLRPLMAVPTLFRHRHPTDRALRSAWLPIARTAFKYGLGVDAVVKNSPQDVLRVRI